MAYGSSDAPATDFAITTVNVPDRLDLRDMDDRRQLEDDTRLRGIDPAVLRVWLPRITLAGIAVIIVFLLWQVVDTWRNTLSAEPLSVRLTASLGTPVHVDNTRFAVSPSPRLIIDKMTIGQDLVLEQVSLRLTSRHIAEMFQGKINWGEAVVGPSTISLAQGHDLLQMLPRLNTALPSGIGVLRFEDLRVADQPWLAGSWHLSLERSASGAFLAISASQATAGGSLHIDLHPESPETVDFDAKASHWVLPFGFRLPVEQASAAGKVSYAQVQVDQYSVSGQFGEIHGNLSGSAENGWMISGAASSDGIDIDGLLKQVAPPAKKADSEGDTPAFAQGMGSFTGHLEGRGSSLEDAVDNSQLTAPLNVRNAVLNGINLGFAAMNPASNPEASGGTTRFSTLDATIVAGSKQTAIRNLRARAGALLALGDVTISSGNEISGVVHVDLGTTRVLAPIRVHVHGTLEKPKFGR